MRAVLAQWQVGRAPVGLALVGRPAPPAGPGRAHPTLAHRAAHLALGHLHRGQAVGAREVRRPHAAVAVAPAGGLEGVAHPRGDLGAAGLSPLVRAPGVLVGALRYPQQGQHVSQEVPEVPPQSLAQPCLLRVREARRVACFWVAQQLPERVAAHPLPGELGLELGYPGLRRSVHADRPLPGGDATTGAPAQPRRDDGPRRDAEAARDVGGAHTPAREGRGLALRRLGVAGVPGVLAAPPHLARRHIELAPLRLGAPGPQALPAGAPRQPGEGRLRQAARGQVGQYPLPLFPAVHAQPPPGSSLRRAGGACPNVINLRGRSRGV